MNRFHLLEHTADIGIEAIADTREGLAEQTGRGLQQLLFGDTCAEALLGEDVIAQGNGPEEALVNWLNELLFLMIDKQFVPAEFEINKFSTRAIAATVVGEHFDAEKHEILREIKAATHHQTSIDHEAGYWRSIVYLDL